MLLILGCALGFPALASVSVPVSQAVSRSLTLRA